MNMISELALYALDVYYNQTYGFGGSGNYGYNQYANKRVDIDTTLPLLYQGYPKYRDPYIDTYRSLGGSWTFDKILEKIQLARETYVTKIIK